MNNLFRSIGLFGAMTGTMIFAPQSLAGDQTDVCRECLENTAQQYLDALLHADPKGVALAPGVQRTIWIDGLNQPLKVHSREEILPKIRGESLTRRCDLRIYVDERQGQVIAFWTASTDLEGTPYIRVMDRIGIKDGLIDDIEVFSLTQTTAPRDPQDCVESRGIR